MAPNHTQLHDMSQRSNESFKEYAQWWREISSRVQPPLPNRERMEIFIGTMQLQYLEKMVRSISSVFSNIVIAGERIEGGL